MDQVEVELIAAEPPHARVERAQSLVEAMIGIAEFRRDEHVGAAGEGIADALLVPIHRRRVDQPIAFVDGHPHDSLGLVGRRLENPKSELRHHRAVVERHRRLGLGGHCASLCWRGERKHGPCLDPTRSGGQAIGARAEACDCRGLREIDWPPRPRVRKARFGAIYRDSRASSGSVVEEPNRLLRNPEPGSTLGRNGWRGNRFRAAFAGDRPDPVPSGGRELVCRQLRRADARPGRSLARDQGRPPHPHRRADRIGQNARGLSGGDRRPGAARPRGSR